MKSIFEQNFDELYAQVEERVKCIEPVKQIDTFTKTLMWTTLNEILMDVFGESRFMWMIVDKDGSFNVWFVDKYRTKSTKELSVEYASILKWPTETELFNMSIDALNLFTARCVADGLTHGDIAAHYNKSKPWFSSLIDRRTKKKQLPRAVAYTLTGEKRRKMCAQKLPENTATIYCVLDLLRDRNIPVSDSILAWTFGYECANDMGHVRTNHHNNSGRWAELVNIERYRVFNYVLKYIDIALNELRTSKRTFSSQKCVLTKGMTSEERIKTLTNYMENKRLEILALIDQTKEVEND